MTEYLDRVSKYVVSSTLIDPRGRTRPCSPGDPVEQRLRSSRAGKDIVLTGSISLATR